MSAASSRLCWRRTTRGIRARPPRWCGPCGGGQLADLVAGDHVVTVTTTGRSAPAAEAVELAGEIGIADLPWTVNYATELLRYARPGGLAFARALVDEGGTATAARLREVIGVDALHPLTATLNAAVRTAVDRRRLRYQDRHLAKPQPPPDNPRSKTVHSYVFPPELVPILDQALTALGRPSGATQLDHNDQT